MGNAQKEYDAIVVGAGPAGSTAAAFLGMAGRRVLLLDKHRFPRDKACGDAISGSLKTHEILGLTELVKKGPHAEVHRVIFSSPKGDVVDIPFQSTGYVCRRHVYDNLVFEKAKKHAEVLEDFTVAEVIKEDGYVKGIKGKDNEGVEKEFRAKIVIGADGALSAVAKQTGCLDLDPEHTLTAIRCYYTGVSGMKDGIELHFVDEIIPGYFWIFPLENGLANVGLGMVVKDFQKKKWKMTDKMFEIISNNPLFKERFKDAKMQDNTLKAWTLPVGSKRRKAHGNGFILAGDAAGLIDAFTGEGISNSMTSGRLAAEWVDKAIKANDFSESFLKQYEDAVWETLGSKLRTSYKLQKLGRQKFLVNLVVGKASKSRQVNDTLRTMMDNVEHRKDLTNPVFYLKLLFA